MADPNFRVGRARTARCAVRTQHKDDPGRAGGRPRPARRGRCSRAGLTSVST